MNQANHSTLLSHSAAGQLIPVFDGILNDEHQPLVDARALHEFLGSGQMFATWIKARVAEYQFAEGIDYARLTEIESGKHQGLKSFFGGNNRVDYHLSLDMAKELAMVERSDKGREVRRYFIAVERAARELEIPAITRKAQAEAERLGGLVEELQDEYCRRMPEMAALLRYRAMGLSHREIGKLLDMPRRSVARRVQRLTALGFISQPQQLPLPMVPEV